jgi:hypothetical protein
MEHGINLIERSGTCARGAIPLLRKGKVERGNAVAPSREVL